MIIETERLVLRALTEADLPALSCILQDEKVMTAYEHAFSDEEVRDWLGRQNERYQTDGFGLWAVVLKETGEMIGQCGLSMQTWRNGQVLEIGYLYKRAHWHKGYAIEAATACKKYAFEVLQADAVHSIIRDTNLASQNVAIRNGMLIRDRCIRHYYNVDMPHLLFKITKKEYMEK